MAKKEIAIIVLIALIAGALGGILFDRLLVPKISQLPGFGWITKYAANSPIVITRNEQVVLNDGVNLIELTKQTSNFTVSIYRGSKPQLIFAGLGVIMTTDGLVFTSKSVVGTNQQMTAVLSDGTSYTATVKALDPKTDLAVMSIPARNLPVAAFGSSLGLQTGQRVVSVGIANREFQRRLSSGAVTNSILNNKFLDQVFNSERFTDSFGTSLIFDPGFIGAPMVNLEGKLIAMYGNERGEMITAENLQAALASFLQTGKITRSRLGIQYWQLSDLQAHLKNLARAGVVVISVEAGSPAAKAALQANDLIFEADGQSLSDQSLESVLNRKTEGAMKVKLLRADQELELTVNLEPTK